MTNAEPVVGIVGSGIAGLRAANALLACQVDAKIVLFGDEAHPTYNRPGLTKNRYPASGDLASLITRDLQIAGAENGAFTRRLGTSVKKADLRGKVLHLGTGETVAYDRLVIASGVRPRTLFEGGAECGSHVHRTLRSLDDARSIHRELQQRRDVTIAGAGFVACELASLAREYGCHIVMLESVRNGPFESILGSDIARALGRWVRQNGVEFLTGAAAADHLCDAANPISENTGAPKTSHAVPPSGRPLFIEAIGSVPNAEWLHGNRLDLSDGVRVDMLMRVAGYDGVFASGDIARYPDPWAVGSLTRREFWKNAIDTGTLAGKSVASSLGHKAKPSGIRYFPSMATDIFGLRIQIAGNPRSADSMEIVNGDLRRLENGLLVSYLRDGSAVGAAYLDVGARFNRRYIELLTSLKKH